MSANEGRTPPHSTEAEQSLIGALLLDNAAFDRVAYLVSAQDFYHPDYRAMFSTIAALIVAHQPADVVTVFERGGHPMAELNALASSVLSAFNSRAYAQIVRVRAVERHAIRLASTMADELLSGLPAEVSVAQRIDRAITELLALSSGNATSEPKSMEELIPAFVDDLNDRAEGKSTAIVTGLDDLDQCTGGGIRAGELWVFGARPSMGKTAIVLTLCRHIASRCGVLMLTQEDSAQALMARNVSASGGVNLADIRNPRRAPQSMWAGVTEGVEALGRLALYIDDQAGLKIADVRRKIQQVRRRCPSLAVVVIDYLQLMEGEGDNRNQELGKIANGLKKAAKEFRIGIVLLSQLNREADKRTGLPQMSDLRDSGDIEGAADLIGLLHREHKRKPTEANKHWAQLHIVKHKNGATDTLNLHFDGALQRFTDWSGPVPFTSAGGSSGYSGGGLG